MHDSRSSNGSLNQVQMKGQSSVRSSNSQETLGANIPDEYQIKPKTRLKIDLNTALVISMNNKIYKLFQISMTFVQCVSSFIYVFYAAFRYDVDFQTFDEYQQFLKDEGKYKAGVVIGFSETEIFYFDWIYYFVEAAFFIDFIT